MAALTAVAGAAAVGDVATVEDVAAVVDVVVPLLGLLLTAVTVDDAAELELWVEVPAGAEEVVLEFEVILVADVVAAAAVDEPVAGVVAAAVVPDADEVVVGAAAVVAAAAVPEASEPVEDDEHPTTINAETTHTPVRKMLILLSPMPFRFNSYST